MRSAIVLMSLALASVCRAEVIAASDTDFRLRHEGHANASPTEVWARLIEPATWWHPDHTYSGDAGHLKLTVTAGGSWREDWAGGSVVHGRVLSVIPEKQLRLDAPFGPLQELGAYTVWTITLTADDSGTTVIFDETAIAPPGANLSEIAKAVDYVKSEAMQRLTAAYD